ncbi:peptidase family m28 domain-containing protein [Phthorimaea operculella]|nr:peptidase family m28 domain-containing protein [Phthorimaea operculella]
MFSTLDTNKISRNTLIDLKGRESPEKLVIVSGHIDSWDVGQGAMDDGGGLIASWAVPVVLKRLNLRPKRTIRSIFWTAEELGLIGAYAYEEKHRNESDNINFIMESDEGTFTPLGLYVGGTQEARCIVAEVLKLFESINASTLIEQSSPGSDIAVMTVFSLIEGKSIEKHGNCDKLLPNESVKEIAGYQDIVDRITEFVTKGGYKGRTYDELARFVDKFGGRPSGSEVLERSIDYMIQRTKEENVNDITTEEVEVPHWERGEEKITMLEPRKKNIALFGLGNSKQMLIEEKVPLKLRKKELLLL